MTPGFAVFILMNNYFHDVATAMPLACGIVLWSVRKQSAGAQQFQALYKGITRVFQFSIAWIFIGGIPRALTFKSFEWRNAVEKHHEAGLIAKYIIAVCIMIAGTYLWSKISKKAREMKEAD